MDNYGRNSVESKTDNEWIYNNVLLFNKEQRTVVAMLVVCEEMFV